MLSAIVLDLNRGVVIVITDFTHGGRAELILIIFDRHVEGAIIGLSESHLRFQISGPSPIRVTPRSLPLILTPWISDFDKSHWSLSSVHLMSANQRVCVIGHQTLGVVLSLIILTAHCTSHDIPIVISLFDNMPKLIC